MEKKKKKSEKKASELFHNIIAASEKGNAKPNMKDSKNTTKK